MMRNPQKLVNPNCPYCGSQTVIGLDAELEIAANVLFSSGQIGLDIKDIISKGLFYITDFECAECGECWEDKTNFDNISRSVFDED